MSSFAPQCVRAVLATSLLCLAPVALAQPSLGPEVRVNTTILHNQGEPAVAALMGGGTVVVWEDDGNLSGANSDKEIRGQVFSSAGLALGPEFPVNTTSVAAQRQPAVAAFDNGQFVVVWTDDSETGGDTDRAAVRGRIFNADGSPAGAEFLVNTAIISDQREPDIAVLPGNRFAVVWTDDSSSGPDTDGSAIRARLFGPTGAPETGLDFQVNTTTPINQQFPAIATLASGGFSIAWMHWPQNADGTSIRARRFSGNGVPLDASDFQVNSTPTGIQTDPALAAPDIAGLADGRIVIVWTDASQSPPDTSFESIRARIFPASGTTTPPDFVVNTTSYQRQFQPNLASLAAGGFLVSWGDRSQATGDQSGFSVRAQEFDGSGAPSGAEFLVNQNTQSDQYRSVVAAHANGAPVFAWEDWGSPLGDIYGSAVVARFAQNCSAPPAGMTFWAQFDTALSPDAVGGMTSPHSTGPTRQLVAADIPGHSGAFLRRASNGARVVYARSGTGPTPWGFRRGNFSIDAWVRIPTANASQASYGTIALIDTRSAAAPTVHGIDLFTSGGRLAFMMATDTLTGQYNTWVSDANIADGQWHHIAVTVRRGNTHGGRLYVDGQHVRITGIDAGNQSVAPLPGNLFFDPTPISGQLGAANTMSIGVDRGHINSNGNGEEEVGFDIDEIEVFDRALTAIEVAGLFAMPKCR